MPPGPCPFHACVLIHASASSMVHAEATPAGRQPPCIPKLTNACLAHSHAPNTPHYPLATPNTPSQEPDLSYDQSWREARSTSDIVRRWQRQAGPSNTQKREALCAWLRSRVAVVDALGAWNARWEEQFTGLRIPHLRSPTSVHPDPTTSWGLEVFAQSK